MTSEKKATGSVALKIPRRVKSGARTCAKSLAGMRLVARVFLIYPQIYPQRVDAGNCAQTYPQGAVFAVSQSARGILFMWHETR
jgi:hypothetical protein